jgi:SlyX protein
MVETTTLEERIAHLTRAVDDLSDVVAHHSAEIDRLSRRVTLLLEREVEREAAGGAALVADERPPHW